MSFARGFVLVLLGAFALWRGWSLHTLRNPWPLCGLGALAIALGAWHLTRRTDHRVR